MKFPRYYYNPKNEYLYKWEDGKAYSYYKPNAEVVEGVYVEFIEYTSLVPINEDEFNRRLMLRELAK